MNNTPMELYKHEDGSLRCRLADGKMDTPFLAINHRPVKVVNLEEKEISVMADGVEGIIRISHHSKPARMEVEFELKSDESKEVRITAPMLRLENDDNRLYFDPNTGGSLRKRQEPFTSLYPAEASLCAVFAINGAGKGLGFGFYNQDQVRVRFQCGPSPEGDLLSATFEKVTLFAGQPYKLPTMYISEGGDWESLLKPYKTWFDTKYTPRTDTPKWVYSKRWLFHYLVCGNPLDEDYDALKHGIKNFVEVCEKEEIIPIIFIQNWWETCKKIKDFWYFDHFQGDFLAACDEVVDLVKYSHDLGAKVVFYINFTAIGEFSEFYKDARPILAMNKWQQPERNGGYPMVMLCPAWEQTKQWWFSVFQYLFQGELALDGIFLDQAGGGYGAPYCYNQGHYHEQPDVYGKGMLDLLRDVRGYIHRINPEALIFGELAQDFRTQYVDFWLWHWFFGGLAEYSEEGETLVWMKYLTPQAYFLDQEPKCSSPYEVAMEESTKGVWLNGQFPKQTREEYHEVLWNAYFADVEIFHSPVKWIKTASPSLLSATMFNPGEKNFILALTQTQNAESVQVELDLPETTVRFTSWPTPDNSFEVMCDNEGVVKLPLAGKVTIYKGEMNNLCDSK